MSDIRLVFYDVETMGLDVNTCPLIDASFIVVSEERMRGKAYSIPELIPMVKKYKLDIAEQVEKYGFVIEEGTLEWWSQQTADARKMIRPSQDDISLVEFVDKVILALENEKYDYYFTRGNTFDPPIMSRIFDTANRGKDYRRLFPYNRVRDIRTWIDAKLNYPKENGFDVDVDGWDSLDSHNSSHDIIKDVLRYQKILRVEEGVTGE